MRRDIKTGVMTAIACLAWASTFAHCADAKATKGAKVSEEQARTLALARVPNGTIQSAELETEHGRLIWSFDISQPQISGVTEIQIDAITGGVALMRHESASQESTEAKAEGREKK